MMQLLITKIKGLRMSLKAFFNKLKKIISFTTTTGVTDGVLGLASGAAGAGIMRAAGYSSYRVIEGALTGGAGNAVVGAGLGLIAIVPAAMGCKPMQSQNLVKGGLVAMVAFQALGGGR